MAQSMAGSQCPKNGRCYLYVIYKKSSGKEGHPWSAVVKHLPAKQETGIQSLGWEDPLDEGMATHSSTLAWRILWTEEPGGLQSTGSQESDTTEQLGSTSAPWAGLLSLFY